VSAVRKTSIIISGILLAVGLAIFVFDAYFICRHGFDMNEVAFVSDDGGAVVDWPTGERAAFTLVPFSFMPLRSVLPQRECSR
jgi:hypothetical protein